MRRRSFFAGALGVAGIPLLGGETMNTAKFLEPYVSAKTGGKTPRSRPTSSANPG